MRVIFCGTPEIAVPSFRAVVEGGHELVAVLTQPDRPAGRGLRPRPNAVKEAARAMGIAALTPVRPRDIRADLEAMRPDAIAVVAYGHIFRPWLLSLPRFGCINVHFSLLPRHRGPAPVAWAILLGDEQTGVSTMRLDEGVDTGPVFARTALPLRPDDTQATLGARLATPGAELLGRTLEDVARGVEPEPQSEAGATHARMLDSSDGRIDWTRPAAEIERRVRGLKPWPGTFSTWRGGLLKVHDVGVAEGELPPGALRVEKDRLLAGAGRGVLVLRSVQPEGKPIMEGASWARGARPARHDRLGS